MAYRDLNEFIDRLEVAGELRRITEPVSPVLEITEITDRVSKAGGPALLFENVKSPSGWPVLINAFGTVARARLALEVDDLDALAADIMFLVEEARPQNLLEKIKLLPRLKRLADVFPKRVSRAPCQEVVLTGDEIDLTAWPVLTCWPGDGGPFITLPLVTTRHPETGGRNLGMYRLQVFGPTETGMHWHAHKGGAQHFRVAESRDERLEAAVALGPDPAVTYAATAPLPEDLDEYLLAGYLRKKPVELVKCVSVDLEVPANAQLVLEGYVEPGERRIEGPFGDHTGYYSPADEYPVFHVTALTRRAAPIYHTTIVGRPPMEDAALGKITERLFLPLIKKQLPEIKDMNLPVEGVFHNLCLVSIDKRYPGHAQKIMHALWGMGQMMFCKMIWVFDAEVDVQDLSEVIWRLGANLDPVRDALLTRGPLDVLDHASDRPAYGGKMGLDCTRKWPEEGFPRDWPAMIEMDPAVKGRIDGLWSRLGLA
jgi:4-hydroxy-3-polyprenylbenzoate decarboxylase